MDYIQYLQVILSTSFADNYIRLNIDRNDYDDDDGNDNDDDDDDGNYDNDAHNDDKDDWDDDNADDDSVRTGAFNFIHCHYLSLIT